MSDEGKITLLPCPFCEGAAKLHHEEQVNQHGPWDDWWVDCKECCAAITPFETREGAVKFWNRELSCRKSAP